MPPTPETKIRAYITANFIPKTPRPSFADHALSTFYDRGLAPRVVIEVRKLQVALVLVAADMGMALVPKSVLRLKRRDVRYKSIEHDSLTSPIIMSMRAQDRSESIRALRKLIYGLYRSKGIPHVQESLDAGD